MAYEVRPSKGDFLVYTVMNLAGYNETNGVGLHPLRAKTREHFAMEINNPILLEFSDRFMSRGRRAIYPARVDMQRMELGLAPCEGKSADAARGLIEQFRTTTDFEEFYSSITPELDSVCAETRQQLANVPFEETLNAAWECTPSFQKLIIPRPLDASNRGEGPLVGNTAIAFVGPGRRGKMITFAGQNILHLAGHEFSHSYVDMLMPDIERIANERGVAKQITHFAEQQRCGSYSGDSAMVETLIRAMQARYIDPFIEPRRSVEESLAAEHRQGMIYVYAFDDALRSHKENPKGSLAEAMVDLATRLSCTQK